MDDGNNNPTTAYCIVLSSGGRVLRNRPVTTWEEVIAIHQALPRNDIAVFEDKDGEGPGAMWAFYPEVQDPMFWR